MKNPFRLESLLNYRKSIEEKLQSQLAVLREKRFMEEEKLSMIKDTQRSILENFHGKIGDIAYLQLLSNEYIYRKEILTDLTNKIAETQKKLIEATKSRKILEKLKDKKIKEFKNYLIQQENKLMDEISAVRFIRTED